MKQFRTFVKNTAAVVFLLVLLSFGTCIGGFMVAGHQSNKMKKDARTMSAEQWLEKYPDQDPDDYIHNRWSNY